jgi:hypothetical protein
MLMMAALLTHFSPTSLQAQEGGGVQIVHKAIHPLDYPYPGTPFQLSMRMVGGDMTEKRVRLFAVLDGKLVDLPVLTTELDDHDNIIYLTTLHAPLTDLAYQFVAYSLDGTAVMSPRYEVKRDCLPRMSFTNLHVNPDLSVPEKLGVLVDQLAGMDNDIQTYEQAAKLLEELQAFVKE